MRADEDRDSIFDEGFESRCSCAGVFAKERCATWQAAQDPEKIISHEIRK
jgi:hypothetical protein